MLGIGSRRNNLKVLIIHNKYKSVNIGGEDVVYKNEKKLLRKALGDDNIFFYEVSNDNLNKLRLIYEIFFSYKHYKKISEIIRINNIDIAHIHNFYPILTPGIFKAASRSRAIVVHTLHNYRLWCISGTFYRDGYGVCELCANKFSLKGIANKCYRKSFSQSILSQFSFWFYRVFKLFDSVDYFFVLTNFQKEKVLQLGINEKRIILKPNSVNTMHNIESQKQGYIYVGRLEESKGIFQVLDVWQNLDKKFVLTIVGVGDLEESLRLKYNQTNIIFKGRCSKKDTLNRISKSKYLIQSSLLYETFGLTIIEAMSFGVPVIGFDIGTRSDFIYNKVNGFLSPIGNLKLTIEKSFEYDKYASLSSNAILKSKEFENNYIIKKQIEIYRNFLKR
jgi:glycosyltransferase involved in cell wall biosynthesis